MGDYIAVAVMVAIISGVTWYLIKKKKSGVGCIGCPYGEKCSKCNCQKNENH